MLVIVGFWDRTTISRCGESQRQPAEGFRVRPTVRRQSDLTGASMQRAADATPAPTNYRYQKLQATRLRERHLHFFCFVLPSVQEEKGRGCSSPSTQLPKLLAEIQRTATSARGPAALTNSKTAALTRGCINTSRALQLLLPSRTSRLVKLSCLGTCALPIEQIALACPE